MKTKTVNNIKYILGTCDIENHQIIKKALKSYWWFHINDKPSAHCIVETDELTEEIKIIASNFIKKTSKQKNDKLVQFCYTQVDNVVLLDKPGLVTFIDRPLLYLLRETSLHSNDINGYFNGSKSFYATGYYDFGNGNKHNIYSPLYLSTKEDCIKYIEMCEYIFNFINKYPVYSIVTIINYIYDMYGFDKNIIKKQIKMFMGELKSSKQRNIKSHINRIFKSFGYDGIYTYIDEYKYLNVCFI